MAFCGNCGTQMEDGAKFCPGCGAASNGAPNPTTPPPAAEKTDFSARVSALNDTADSTAQFTAADVQAGKTMAILAYLGPLVLIPLFGAKEQKFARYHTNQGLVLLLASIAWSVVYNIVSWILLAISWRLYTVVSIIGFLSLVFFVLCIIGIVNAVNGRAKELPVIGRFRLIK